MAQSNPGGNLRADIAISQEAIHFVVPYRSKDKTEAHKCVVCVCEEPTRHQRGAQPKMKRERNFGMKMLPESSEGSSRR